MATYKYEGVDRAGKSQKGNVVARNDRDARRVLRSQGIRVKKLNEPSIFEVDLNQLLAEKGLVSAFGTKELTLFTKQLGVMINAGVPIMQALEILYKAERHPLLKKSVKEISMDVGGGKTIAEALDKQKGFSKLYVNMVKAGESGGVLDDVLNKLAEHMERQQEISRKIKSAMTYPIIVVIVGIAVVIGMMYFVVPKFQEMLQSNGQELPAITQFVIDVSEFMQNYILHVVGGIFLFFVLLRTFVSSKQGKPIADIVLMNSPIFGSINIKGNLATLCRTLSTMLSSGVSLIDALDICIDTLSNSKIAEDMKEVKRNVVQGKTLTEPLTKIKYFPEMVAQMIRVGEQTGNLDSMLMKISEVFEQELNYLIDNMTKMIEPIIIVVLGGMVAVILLAMYMPIFMGAGGSG
jgi:type IV pilus assembly protein PilC